MKKTMLALALATLATPLLAAGGNGAPSGPHYNLNIIGVAKGKKASMTNDGHRIFVALGANTENGNVVSRIYLTRGDFKVCDANAFDAAYDCDGNQIQNQGAVFQLPCNTNLPDDQVGGLIPCDENGETSFYEVWVRALGQPGGNATMTTCAYDPQLATEICSTENVFLVRYKGQSSFENRTRELTSLVGDIDGDGDAERVALFAGGLEDWFWNYDNKGLRLAQLRFYEFDQPE